jgi:hypothetical protein
VPRLLPQRSAPPRCKSRIDVFWSKVGRPMALPQMLRCAHRVLLRRRKRQAAATGAVASALRARVGRYSVYLLYWYKSTNNDTCKRIACTCGQVYIYIHKLLGILLQLYIYNTCCISTNVQILPLHLQAHTCGQVLSYGYTQKNPQTPTGVHACTNTAAAFASGKRTRVLVQTYKYGLKLLVYEALSYLYQ